jgi:hypothetical protein
MNSGSRELFTGINTLMTRFVAGMSADESGAIVQGNVRETSRTYNIGDTGPGGGIIFHVEGNTYFEVSRLLGDHTWDNAVRIARDFRGGGFDDWYLPSRGELELIYRNLQRSNIINLGTQFYWSSVQSGSSHAWAQSFSTGSLFNQSKSSTHSVRAVRAF